MIRSLVAALLLFILLAALAGLWLRHELATPYYGAAGEEAFIEIPRGTTTSAIADILTEAGVLHRRIPFMLYLRWNDSARHLKAGEYRFAAPATPAQIVQRLVRGEVYYRSITIPEGLTARETVEHIAKSGLGNLEEMDRALRRTEWIGDLDPRAQSLEGYLFPETYRFSRKITSEHIVKTMVDQFREEFKKLTVGIPMPPDWNVARIVTLASLVEKEAKSREERLLVASVLSNRLDKSMPLACDPTVIYALKLAGTYEGNIRKADLTRESPYNTYIHKGLPPGPIANPGTDSLRAALIPAKTDYLYYVSRNDGTHQFSKDFRTHAMAVNRYQRRPKT